MNTAILFLVFNRPDTTSQVFEAIRKAKPPRLYVAADGPRLGRKEEIIKCKETRLIATNVDWPCTVITLFREENLGCKIAVSSAIDWFFEREEEGIILEDDILPSQTFFSFCERLLIKYRNESNVALISGCNPAERTFKNQGNYSFSHYGLIWGWASWRRAWADYDVDIIDWQNKKNEAKDWMSYSNPLYVSMWSNIFDSVATGKVDTWDYQLNYMLMSKSKVSIIPCRNLIDNIGYGEDATHTVDGRPSWLLGASDMNIESISYVVPKVNVTLDKHIGALVFGITKWSLVKHYIKLMLKIIFKYKVKV